MISSWARRTTWSRFKIKAAVAGPVIGSLNGTTEGGWFRYARLTEQAGADGLGLNLYELTLDLGETGTEVSLPTFAGPDFSARFSCQSAAR
jgi:hypothetical protein